MEGRTHSSAAMKMRVRKALRKKALTTKDTKYHEGLLGRFPSWNFVSLVV